MDGEGLVEAQQKDDVGSRVGMIFRDATSVRMIETSEGFLLGIRAGGVGGVGG